MNEFESALLAVPTSKWKVGRLYATEVYDAPRGGLCALLDPACEFVFELLDERYNPEGLDDRLFRLGELPIGSVAQVLAIPQGKSAEQLSANDFAERIDSIVGRLRPAALVIHSRDMEDFLGCWHVPSPENVTDWFAFLKIPPAKRPSAAKIAPKSAK